VLSQWELFTLLHVRSFEVKHFYRDHIHVTKIINLAQNGDKWLALLNTVMKLSCSDKC
jgi:hypothetical protein